MNRKFKYCSPSVEGLKKQLVRVETTVSSELGGGGESELCVQTAGEPLMLCNVNRAAKVY